MREIYVDVRSSNNFLRKVFIYMILGITISFFIPLYVYNYDNSLLRYIVPNYRILGLVQLIMVFSLSASIHKIPTGLARILFFVYSILNGLTFSTIGFVYDSDSVLYVFGLTLMVFIITAIYGFRTSEDLSNYRRFLRIGLFSVIGISIVNIFLKASILYWIGSVVGVVLFTAFIAYDINRIKQISIMVSEDSNHQIENMAIIGALHLYLDFINLFFYLLSFFGKKK